MAVDTIVTGSKLTAIANALRAKLGSQDRYTLDQIATAIATIPSGGGGSIAEQALYAGYNTTPDSRVDIAAGDWGSSDGTNTVVRAYAFGCESASYQSSNRLRSVEFPAWVTQLDYRAFYYSSVQSLVASGSTILSIGQGVFMYSKLTSLALDRVVELHSYGSQFSMCTSLATVDQKIMAKSGTTYVPGNCFSGCTALRSVKLKSDASTISFAVRALGGCTSLMELVLDFGVVASFTSNSLADVPAGCEIYVRDALVAGYQAAQNLSDRSAHIHALSDYPVS